MRFAGDRTPGVVSLATIVASAWLCGLVAALWFKPPQGALSSQATGPETSLAFQSVFFVTIAVVLGTVAMVWWADKQHLRAWLIAAAVSATAVIWSVTELSNTEPWRCQQMSGAWKIVGDDSTLRDGARQKMAEFGVTACGYLWKDEGNVEDVWTSDSVVPRRTAVGRLYRPIAPLFACLILAAGGASLIARRSRPEESITPTLAAARARLRIFINYRTLDTEDAVDSLYKYLIRYFDPQHIFRDKEGIQAGAEYEKAIMAAIESSHVFLAVVGPLWLTVEDETGRRRLDDPSDLLRREIERALATDSVTVMPLLHNTKMPKASGLPATMAAFAKKQARPLRSEPDLKHDETRLLAELDRIALAKARRG